MLSPTSNLGINGGSQHPDKRKAGGHGPTLADQVEHTLPTPTAVQGRNATSGRKPDAEFNTGTTLQDVCYADKWGEYADAIARWETIHGPAPEPTDAKGRLSPSFVTWMMGWPTGWAVATGAPRAQQLKMLGNGVVPHQAVAAYSFLLGATA